MDDPTLTHGTLIDEQLRQSETGLLYQVEHQSSPDPLMRCASWAISVATGEPTCETIPDGADRARSCRLESGDDLGPQSGGVYLPRRTSRRQRHARRR